MLNNIHKNAQTFTSPEHHPLLIDKVRNLPQFSRPRITINGLLQKMYFNAKRLYHLKNTFLPRASNSISNSKSVNLFNLQLVFILGYSLLLRQLLQTFM